MSKYPYLEKAVKHYKDRFKKRRPIRNEAAEYNELKQALRKAEAWDEFVEYFDSVVSEEGYVSATDENIVINIQNIRMKHQFESEESE